MDKYEKAQRNLAGRCLRCNKKLDTKLETHGHHMQCPDRPKTVQEQLTEKLSKYKDMFTVDGFDFQWPDSFADEIDNYYKQQDDNDNDV